MADQPNPRLVHELREALAKAEKGIIVDGVIVAIGANDAHHGFAVQAGPHRLVSLLGELGLCKTGLENMLITERMSQQQDRAAGIVRRN